ncbi:hypothetical protein ABPG72_020810 [Tetrahymena utriculariae]
MEAFARIADYNTICRFAILGLIFALNGCVYATIPIIFYRPQFYCPKQGAFDSNNQQIYVPCDEMDACNSNELYRVSTEYPEVNSISMEFNLYCGRKFIETTILTMMAAGQIFAFVVGTAVYVHPKKQYNYFIYGNAITGILLCLSYFITNPFLLIPILFVWNTYYGLYMSIIFAHLNFFFNGVLSKFGPSIYNTAWPIFMLLYCLFTYYFGFWRQSLVIFAGIPYLFLTALLIYFKPTNQRPLSRQNQNAVSDSFLQNNLSNSNQLAQQQQQKYQPPALKQQLSEQDGNKLSKASELPKSNFAANTPTSSTQIQSFSTSTQKVPSSQNININNNQSIFKKVIKKNALNQRLLDTDKHELTIKTPAAASIQQKKMDESLKIMDETAASTTPSSKKLPKTNTTAWEDFKNQLKSIHENEKYYKNVVIFILCWLGTNIAYFGCLLVMGDLGGDLYTNVAFSTVFEFLGNFCATFLIIKFPERQILRVSFLIVGVSYISCLFFDPLNQEVGNGYTLSIILSLIPIIIAKGTHEMLWTVLQTYLNILLPPEFHQFSFACSNLVSVIVMDLLPLYKYLMEMLKFNQFFGYGLYCIFTFYIIQFFEDLYKEDGKPIFSDYVHAEEGKEDIEMQLVKDLSLAAELIKTI